MIKRLTFAAVLLVWVLAACTPLATPESAIKSTATTSLLYAITPVGKQASPTPLQASPTPLPAGNNSNANCTVVSSIFPTPNPTQAAQVSLFKPVSDSDWIIGNKEASITFLEYSDFQ